MADMFKTQLELAKQTDARENRTTATDTVGEVVRHFCNVASNDNPRFDRHRFLQACGY